MPVGSNYSAVGRQPHPVVPRESAESLRACRRRFPAERLVIAHSGGSLHQGPRATHNPAPYRISRTVGDFRRPVSLASSRPRQPLRAPSCLLPKEWLPEADAIAKRLYFAEP
jgi:hypothetical protein